jgi:hypothetical protein
LRRGARFGDKDVSCTVDIFFYFDGEGVRTAPPSGVAALLKAVRRLLWWWHY